jgi:hypothetical protein
MKSILSVRGLTYWVDAVTIAEERDGNELCPCCSEISTVVVAVVQRRSRLSSSLVALGFTGSLPTDRYLKTLNVSTRKTDQNPTVRRTDCLSP